MGAGVHKYSLRGVWGVHGVAGEARTPQATQLTCHAQCDGEARPVGRARGMCRRAHAEEEGGGMCTLSTRQQMLNGFKYPFSGAPLYPRVSRRNCTPAPVVPPPRATPCTPAHTSRRPPWRRCCRRCVRTLVPAAPRLHVPDHSVQSARHNAQG